MGKETSLCALRFILYGGEIARTDLDKHLLIFILTYLYLIAMGIQPVFGWPHHRRLIIPAVAVRNLHLNRNRAGIGNLRSVEQHLNHRAR